MTKKRQNLFLRIILIFVMIQPFLDILSRLAILDIIPNISTYVKPLFVFGFMFYLLVFYSPIWKKWITYIFSFIIFTFIHLFILYKLLVDSSIIIHEFRFMLNIAYMIALFISLFTLYYHSDDKDEMFRRIKNTLFYTFMLYFVLYLISVFTGTSGMTYEYSDKYKLGYKGWYDSGQILGHAFSISFPLLLYIILKPKTKRIVRTIFVVMSLIVVSLIGTKVPYFITLIVLILYLVIVLFLKLFNKKFERNIFNILLVSLSIIGLLCTYKYTPVKYNTDINTKNAQIELSKFDLNSISGKKNKSLDDLKASHKGEDTSYLEKYYNWGEEASDYLEGLFYSGKVHPSDTRAKQLYYSYKKFMLSDVIYKLFGIGYLNQDSMLSIERDFFMALFDFGIFGFILFLTIPIYEFIMAFVFIVKNFKRIDLETYMLFMGFGIFFCISIYAGYTYIYTNFSIFLVLLIVMLKIKIDTIKRQIFNEKKVKSISFLSLHLGYGGIESSIVNSANALSKKYDVEIISFYKLANDQISNVYSKVKVKYLYDGGPNKDEIFKYMENRKCFKLFFELIKAIKILLLKKFLIIYNIISSKSDCIVSTRVEFNLLLDRYGKMNTLKIAQEHCYHNNNNKYINKIKSYYRLDYLCALTETLKVDYLNFLEKNSVTKVVLLPNMLINIPSKKSKLNNNNLITVSRLDYGKRVNEIIDIFSKIDDKKAKLYVIGDGCEFNNLKKQVNEMNISDRVNLLGYLDHDKIEKYFLDSSIFLMASVTEGLPMVLLESMSYGVPCIAYKTASGTSDIIRNGNGFIIEGRNECEYIDSINKLLGDNTLRKTYGENASNTALEFYRDNVLKIWDKILKKEI